MLVYLNMVSRVTFGNALENISGIEINENILEMSNAAKVTIPRDYAKLAGKAFLEQFKVSDKVKIEIGYYTDEMNDGTLVSEFTGYIRGADETAPGSGAPAV